MTFPDILRRSWHNLGRAKVRVGLTAAALAIGGATMTLALAITQGVSDTLEKGFGNLRNNVVMVEGFLAENTSDTGVRTSEEAERAFEGNSSKRLGVQDVQKFEKTAGVQEALPLNYYSFNSVTINGKSYQPPSVQPLTPLDNLEELVVGTREDLTGNTIILPERYAKEAGVSNPADFIGKTLTFVRKGSPGFFGSPGTPDTKVELTVVGLTKSDADATSAAYESAYLSPETISGLVQKERGVTDASKVTYQRILLMTDEKQTEVIKQGLREQGYDAQTRQDAVGKALEAVNAIRTFFLVFAGIAIFTAVFGVINTQLMAVLERTREIGVMKALGLSKGGVLLMFSIEAGWIGLLGSLAGTLLAIPISLVLTTIGGSDDFSAPITLPNFLLVVGVLVAIAMLSGLLPARRAAKLDPVEALRNE